MYKDANKHTLASLGLSLHIARTHNPFTPSTLVWWLLTQTDWHGSQLLFSANL